jgi:UDP-GlcNAc3NAcA epimerase
MIKIVTIIGARPQIIKAAAISRCIKNSFKKEIQEVIVHTGQHYDKNMSEVFFSEMEIPKPKYNLGVGSMSHAKQTALMMEKIEEVLIKEKPNLVILYGDTNSTLAGSVAAAKIHIPVVHIEAGLRSFNKSMPEEINRIVCDHTSTLLFSPTPTGIDNLKNEGINLKNKSPYSIDNPGVFHCGDIMFDNAKYYVQKAEKKSFILKELKLKKNIFLLATIHRDNNTDDPKRLNSIFSAIHKISSKNKLQVIIPLHPRTSKILKTNLKSQLYRSITENPFITIIPPVSFFEMINLEKNSFMIITDSGGVQKEAYFYKRPCIIIRSETEWVEIVKAGAAKICDADENKIINAFNFYKSSNLKSLPSIFGNGKAADFIIKKIIQNFKTV